MNAKEERAIERLGRLHRLRDLLWEHLEDTDELYHPVLFLVEDAIRRQNDEIALMRGAKIEKRHCGKKYVFEVVRHDIGIAEVYLNGEKLASLMDEVVSADEPSEICTDIVRGWGSRIPDTVFVKSLLYSPSDEVCHLSDKVKAVLDRDIPEKIRIELQRNAEKLARRKKN